MRLNSGMSLPDGFHEGFRRIDSDDRVITQPLDQLGRECPGTTSDVDHPLPGRYADEVREHGSERDGVPAHEPVVGVRRDLKPHESEPAPPMGPVPHVPICSRARSGAYWSGDHFENQAASDVGPRRNSEHADE